MDDHQGQEEKRVLKKINAVLKKMKKRPKEVDTEFRINPSQMPAQIKIKVSYPCYNYCILLD